MLPLSKILAQLKRHYKQIEAPPAESPLALVLWENACYLLPDDRRREVYNALKEQVGLNAAAIDRAPDAVLVPLAKRGGMRPEVRVFRWREIARITLNQFGGDLDVILERSFPEAKRALKQFPNIGDPGGKRSCCFAEWPRAFRSNPMGCACWCASVGVPCRKTTGACIEPCRVTLRQCCHTKPKS